jgi:hypothetical protein
MDITKTMECGVTMTSAPVSRPASKHRRPVALIRAIALTIMSCSVAPSPAGPADTSGVCSTAQTDAAQNEALRHRLESLRNSRAGAAVSFTGRFESHSYRNLLSLRPGGDCSYEVAGDMSGLIDILLSADLRVGYPSGWDIFKPEAGFAIFIGVNSPEEIDLWFANPRSLAAARDLVVVGQIFDSGEVSAHRISAEGKLRDALWTWARAHGYPQPAAAAHCREIEQFDPPYPSPVQ